MNSERVHFDNFDVFVATTLPAAVIGSLAQHFPLRQPVPARRLENIPDEIADRVHAIACGAGILSDGTHVRIDGPFMSRFPKLEIVANLGVGYDNIDASWARDHEIIVTNTPDVLTDEVADLAMGLLLATIREIPQADRYLREGRWPAKAFRLTSTLLGRKLGILGLGRIGSAIARRAESFGLNVLYHGRQRQPVSFTYCPSVLELARACDILMVVAPGGEQTRHLVDAHVLQALGPEGVLINIARGSLVDERALISALQEGVIAAAGLDVFANEPHVPQELISLDNVVLLPHVGSGSRQTRAAMAQLVVDNLVSWAQGHGPLTPVNETPWRRKTGSN